MKLLVRLYRWIISPAIHTLAGPGMGCRFEPSCSEFAEQAFHRHSFFKAARLTSGRILRCHPFCEGGYDPVPTE